MFKETPDGQTHYQGDGCGEPAHNPSFQTVKEEALREFDEKFSYPHWTETGYNLKFIKDFLSTFADRIREQAILEESNKCYEHSKAEVAKVVEEITEDIEDTAGDLEVMRGLMKALEIIRKYK